MADYTYDAAELRRAHALDEAIRNLGFEATTDDIISRAKAFEVYLISEAAAVTSVQLNDDAIKAGDTVKYGTQTLHVVAVDGESLWLKDGGYHFTTKQCYVTKVKVDE